MPEVSPSWAWAPQWLTWNHSSPSTPETTIKVLLDSPDGTRDLFREKFASWVGNPKHDIWLYVKSQWIRVPEIFPDFATAVASDRKILIRSDNPTEYGGVSWLHQSYICEKEDLSGMISLRVLPYILDELIELYDSDPSRGAYYSEQNLKEYSLDDTLMRWPRDKDWRKKMYIFLLENTKNSSYLELDHSKELSINISDGREIQTREEKWENTSGMNYEISHLPSLHPGWTTENLIDIVMEFPDYSPVSVFFSQKWKPYISGIGTMEESASSEDIRVKLVEDEESRNPDREIWELDFSLWEYIEGTNYAVCQDSWNPDKYYIYKWTQHGWYDVIVVSKNKQGKFYSNGVDYNHIIEFYESVRWLKAFDTNQCPIIEIQESTGDNPELYFLQYHPTEPRQPSWVHQEINSNQKWHKVPFTRWSTEGSPVTFTGDEVMLIDISLLKSTFFKKRLEVAALQKKLFIIFVSNSSIGLRRRGFVNGLDDELIGRLIGDNLARSVLHKPEITMMITEGTKIAFSSGDQYGNRLDLDPNLKLTVQSDGTTWYIFVDTSDCSWWDWWEWYEWEVDLTDL